MKNLRFFVVLLLLCIATPFVIHHRAWASQSAQLGTGQEVGLRIVAPKPGDKLAQTFVAVQYQPMTPTAAGTPTYEVRLDGRDPVKTTDTTYTFNGVTPGSHDLVVQIVDANGTPVAGTRSEVKFVTTNPTAGANPAGPGAAVLQPLLPLPQNGDLPDGNGSLPLLSVIGFGILVGGVISALRTRQVHK
jgi:hypothetical protein